MVPHPADPFAERGRIVWRHYKSADTVLDDLRHAGNIGADNRGCAGHPFEQSLSRQPRHLRHGAIYSTLAARKNSGSGVPSSLNQLRVIAILAEGHTFVSA